MKNTLSKLIISGLGITLLAGCQYQAKESNYLKWKQTPPLVKEVDSNDSSKSFYGTLEPFASEAVYFLMTDRFVDGDPSNNQVDQGGQYPTFKQPIKAKDGRSAYVGYMGGDFQGILDNAAYIKDMGFTAIWLTPIVDNPDEAFAGGEPIEFGGAFKDGGKTGYHGYWGVNFFKTDEHLPSANLDFKTLTKKLKKEYQLKTVLDIVLNHGSPSFTMPVQQPKHGQLFDENGKLIADHQNLEPEALDPNNPLHQFYNVKKDIMQLSDLNQDNPEVLDYFSRAYLYWIEQGADAFRIDTIKHMPHSFWKKFTDKIRKEHPDFYMFAESYSFDPEFIAQHTQPENGGISVLDFPGKEAMTKVFENPNSDFSELESYLYLSESPYKNPYELTTFYDNHDMQRISATQEGFIDAHNWLFTTRGIPVVYYGSEIGFMAGTKEHEGNRNYFGQKNIEKAKQHPIRKALKKVAEVRQQSVALQRGLQVNLTLKGNLASFYRVYEHDGVFQTALVLLNKSNEPAQFEIKKYLSEGQWRNAVTGKKRTIKIEDSLSHKVAAHSFAVFLLDQKNTNPEVQKQLVQLMQVVEK